MDSSCSNYINQPCIRLPQSQDSRPQDRSAVLMELTWCIGRCSLSRHGDVVVSSKTRLIWS
ncbi:hypothetical protein SynA1825c_01394 [Synechococcus sp. A18-25c]|nr:hypothetical protein SynA1560_01412 [Synechococcus sp. A15-60]QNJ19700.1 hypothetical protein SynA1825c_01394 [Synechococcus sp. A18-25c]